MKKIIPVFLMLLAIESIAQSRDETAIHGILNAQIKEWNRGDIENFMKSYWENDSLMFIGKSGVTHGWDNTLKNYKKNYPDTTAMGKLSFTIIEVKKLSKKYYHVVGKWHLKRSIDNQDGHFTLLFKKISGNWVIVSDHSS